MSWLDILMVASWLGALVCSHMAAYFHGRARAFGESVRVIDRHMKGPKP